MSAALGQLAMRFQRTDATIHRPLENSIIGVTDLLLLRRPLSLSFPSATKSCDGHASAIPNAIEEPVNSVRTPPLRKLMHVVGIVYHKQEQKQEQRRGKRKTSSSQCSFGPAPFDVKRSVLCIVRITTSLDFV